MKLKVVEEEGSVLIAVCKKRGSILIAYIIQFCQTFFVFLLANFLPLSGHPYANKL